eukprot:TRINITY_DN56868_c0_g1_i1.p1 TRINITY_DN56868_c0_g1~~TRINITY_DN56868_c0_g1_i1.p1  ORF type:complete len:1431 (-),score=384.86 TRINITY_DN56868_c0_g1_i1:285-4577(-)
MPLGYPEDGVPPLPPSPVPQSPGGLQSPGSQAMYLQARLASLENQPARFERLMQEQALHFKELLRDSEARIGAKVEQSLVRMALLAPPPRTGSHQATDVAAATPEAVAPMEDANMTSFVSATSAPSTPARSAPAAHAAELSSGPVANAVLTEAPSEGPREARPELEYLVDISRIKHTYAGTAGLGHRFSKELDDRDPEMTALWGSMVVGRDEGDGWLKVGKRYLPIFLAGEQVLVPLQDPPLTYEEHLASHDAALSELLSRLERLEELGAEPPAGLEAQEEDELEAFGSMPPRMPKRRRSLEIVEQGMALGLQDEAIGRLSQRFEALEAELCMLNEKLDRGVLPCQADGNKDEPSKPPPRQGRRTSFEIAAQGAAVSACDDAISQVIERVGALEAEWNVFNEKLDDCGAMCLEAKCNVDHLGQELRRCGDFVNMLGVQFDRIQEVSVPGRLCDDLKHLRRRQDAMEEYLDEMTHRLRHGSGGEDFVKAAADPLSERIKLEELLADVDGPDGDPYSGRRPAEEADPETPSSPPLVRPGARVSFSEDPPEIFELRSVEDHGNADPVRDEPEYSDKDEVYFAGRSVEASSLLDRVRRKMQLVLYASAKDGSLEKALQTSEEESVEEEQSSTRCHSNSQAAAKSAEEPSGTTTAASGASIGGEGSPRPPQCASAAAKVRMRGLLRKACEDGSLAAALRSSEDDSEEAPAPAKASSGGGDLQAKEPSHHQRHHQHLHHQHHQQPAVDGDAAAPDAEEAPEGQLKPTELNFEFLGLGKTDIDRPELRGITLQQNRQLWRFVQDHADADGDLTYDGRPWLDQCGSETSGGSSSSTASPKPTYQQLKAQSLDFRQLQHWVIKPATAHHDHCSLVELMAPKEAAGVGQRPKWFCCHAWSDTFADCLAALETHATERVLRSSDAWWLDAFATDRHHHHIHGYHGHHYHHHHQGGPGGQLAEARRSASAATSLDDVPFLRAMRSAEGVLLFLGSNGEPFQRLWCCFEVACAFSIGKLNRRAWKRLLLDMVATPDGQKNSAPCLLADGLTQAERKSEMERPGSGWRSKARREASFPLRILERGYEVDVTTGGVHQNSDRNFILGAISTGQCEAHAQPPATCSEYDKANAALRGIFAGAASRRAAVAGRLRAALEALSGDAERKELMLDLRFSDVENLEDVGGCLQRLRRLERLEVVLEGCQKLTSAEAIGTALGSLTHLRRFLCNARGCPRLADVSTLASLLGTPSQLLHLSLDFSGCQALAGLDSLGASLSRLKHLQRLELQFSRCPQLDRTSSFLGIGCADVPPPPRLEHLEVDLSGCRVLSDITGMGQWLRGMPQLRHVELNLEDAPVLTDVSTLGIGLQALKKLQHVTLLFQGCMQLSDVRWLGDALTGANNLKHLEVDLFSCPRLTPELQTMWNLSNRDALLRGAASLEAFVHDVKS